ncbi:metallophosphoesterase family protein [[Curtobacterium] plantarum]|uniref:metallophosphoesterase family protein n=1 Tax=[Curtobacterium] plantarum TaxID=221276 RepID=UPI0013148CA6
MPQTCSLERDGHRFFLVHAIPSSPLYGVLDKDSAEWEAELMLSGADFLLTVHTHIPFIRDVNGRKIINVGSIGQPRNGKLFASYAIYEDGKFSLHTYSYPVETTIQKTQALPLASHVKEKLIQILATGTK